MDPKKSVIMRFQCTYTYCVYVIEIELLILLESCLLYDQELIDEYLNFLRWLLNQTAV